MRSNFVAFVALLCLTSAASAQTPHFCERMASQTKMKPDKKAPAGTAWQVNKLGGLGTFLFGGKVSFMLSIKPDPAADEAAKLANTCQSSDKDIVCNVKGPAILKLTINSEIYEFQADNNETAVVSIIDSQKFRCEIPDSA